MTIHLKSETDLRQLAKDCLDQYTDTDDAWATYRDEANARYAAEDDGDHAEYAEVAAAIFKEAKIATVDLGDGDDDDTDTSNVIEHPAAAAKRQADEQAAERRARYAESEAQEKKDRSERRKHLKLTKSLRDAAAKAQGRRDSELRQAKGFTTDWAGDPACNASYAVYYRAMDAYAKQHGPVPDRKTADPLALATYLHEREEAGEDARHSLQVILAKAVLTVTEQTIAEHYGCKTYAEYLNRIENEDEDEAVA